MILKIGSAFTEVKMKQGVLENTSIYNTFIEVCKTTSKPILSEKGNVYLNFGDKYPFSLKSGEKLYVRASNRVVATLSAIEVDGDVGSGSGNCECEETHDRIEDSVIVTIVEEEFNK